MDYTYAHNPSELVGTEVTYAAEFAGCYIHSDNMYPLVGGGFVVESYDDDDHTFNLGDGESSFWVPMYSMEWGDVVRLHWRSVTVGQYYKSSYDAETAHSADGFFYYREYTKSFVDNDSQLLIQGLDGSEPVRVVDMYVKNEDANDVAALCEYEGKFGILPYTVLHAIEYYRPRRTVYEFNEWEMKHKK